MKKNSMRIAMAGFLCSAWLAGCTKSQPVGQPEHVIVHRNPPVGDKVMVSEDGKTFMPLIGGENYFIHSPTTTNYQEAVNRLWNYRQTTPPDKPYETNPNGMVWREYAR